MDAYALRAANLLAGNAHDTAAIEITFMGPTLEALCDADIALTGADMGTTINEADFPMWRSVRVQAGSIVRVRRAVSGCRAYLAIAGGIDAPIVMGSRSTYVNGRIGGIDGRALRRGDVLSRRGDRLLQRPRRLPWRPLYSDGILLRAVPGPQDDYFRESIDLFFSSAYTVAPQADRMGCRLLGAGIERDPGAPQSITSEVSAPGNIQVPPDGQPIILMVEQTFGGYAKIATVITPDLFRVAQAVPGSSVRFAPVSITEAHGLFKEWSDFMENMEAAITSASR
jgi:biotin-dependent carboxylase-like uncharacterized protein